MVESIFDKQMKDLKFKAIYEEVSSQLDNDEKKAELRYKSNLRKKKFRAAPKQN